MDKKSDEEIEAEVQIKEKIEAVLRSYFSIRHIKSAVYFAKDAYKLEKQASKKSIDLIEIHQACITAAIFTTIAFLEATINEILRDSNEAVKGASGYSSNYIPDQLINKLGQFYERPKKERIRFSVLEKYREALTLAGKEPFDKTESLYQNVDSFRLLRNSLVHYEPKTSEIQLMEDYIPVDELAKKLYCKFELNPLTGKGNPFFPDKCLSYGCCRWGIESSIAFADEFCKRTKIKAKYQNIHSKLLLD